MKYLLSAIILILAGCALPPAEEPSFAGKYRNACLPEAIAMTQNLRHAGIQARVLRIGTNKWNHAICVYLYQPGSNTLWGWDSYWKSNRLIALSSDPHSIARMWLRVTASDATLVSAEFLDSNSFK
jgi:hypothetical protein